MPHVLVRHQIADYEKWREALDGPDAILHDTAAESGMIFRNIDQPDEIFVLLEWPVLDSLRDFMQSDELKEEMRRAGVTGKPDIWYLDELEPPQI